MKKILIVEDDKFMADIYREVLKADGFDPSVCSNGTSAKEFLKESPPDLVLLDIMLPGTGGPEVLTFIRTQKATSNVPVIVLSNANAYADDLVRTMQMQGANLCLSKSECTPKRLIAEVRQALAKAAPAPNKTELPQIKNLML